jgi:hypothetical protein
MLNRYPITVSKESLVNGMIDFVSNEMQIGNWSFHSISLEDQLLFYRFINETEYPANLWSSNFAYLWASSQGGNRKTVWKIVDGALVPFFYNTHHQILFLVCLPLGKAGSDYVVEVLYKCMKYCYEFNKFSENENYTRVRTINEFQLQFLKPSSEFDKYFRLKKLSGIERHYSIEKLLNLKGKEFNYVRRKINKFHRLYPQAIIRAYQPEDYNKLMLLNAKWESQKNTTIEDRTYYKGILKNSSELNHTVLVVEIDRQIVGMTSGGCLPTGQSWVCLRKGYHDIEGLSEVLVYELAKECYRINPSIEYMNDGSDLADEGLRFFKERFRPELNLNRYRIYLK